MVYGSMFSSGSLPALGLPALVLAAAISGAHGQGCSGQYAACGSTCTTFQEATPGFACSTSCCSGLSCVPNKGDGNTFCRPVEGEPVEALPVEALPEDPTFEEEPVAPVLPPPTVPELPAPGVPAPNEGDDGVFEGQGEGIGSTVGDGFEPGAPATPPAVPVAPTTPTAPFTPAPVEGGTVVGGSTAPPGPAAEPAFPPPGFTEPTGTVLSDAPVPPRIPTRPAAPIAPTTASEPTPPTSAATPTAPAPPLTPAGTDGAEPIPPPAATAAFPVPGAPPTVTPEEEEVDELPAVPPPIATEPAPPFPTLGDVVDVDEDEEDMPAVATDAATPTTAAITPRAANTTAAANTTVAGDEEATALESGTAPEPDEAALMELGYAIQEGVDYIPSPTKLTMVEDIGNGTLVATAEECAALCDAETSCNIFAYLTTDFYNGWNCFLKTLDPGCMFPTDLDPLPGAWLAISELRCDVNATALGPAMGPAAVMMGVYEQFLGKDYIPATAALFNGTGPNLVDVVDIGEGLLVDDAEACEAACDAEPECNAASFYLEPNAETMTNCFLKQLGDSCMLPPDATDDDNAVLSLKCDDGALAPASAPLGTDPINGTAGVGGDTTTSRDFSAEGPGAAAGEVADDAARAPAAVFTGLAAVLAAGAAALV